MAKLIESIEIPENCTLTVDFENKVILFEEVKMHDIKDVYCIVGDNDDVIDILNECKDKDVKLERQDDKVCVNINATIEVSVEEFINILNQ